jgi:hypothetical protein
MVVIRRSLAGAVQSMSDALNFFTPPPRLNFSRRLRG